MIDCVSIVDDIKLYFSENKELFNNEEKYAFLMYIFKLLEGKEEDDLTICFEEFPGLKANVDGYYYDVDSSTYNLYIVEYDDIIKKHTTLSKEGCDVLYSKITNLVKKIYNNSYREFDESSFTYEICEEIRENLKNSEIVVNVITNYNISPEYQKDDIEEIDGYRVSFRTYDFEDLNDKLKQLEYENVELNCEERFGKSITALKISSTSDFDTYMCSMKGNWLAQLYKDDSLGLLDPNVRSYLKRTAKVNAGILETVKSYPEQFVSYNNGISAVATGVSFKDENSKFQTFEIKKISNFQIVNGGQTTATLAECAKDKLIEELQHVIVPVKLTVVKNLVNASNLISNISVFSNSQTAIKKSDPPSNLPYYIKIKELSKRCISSDLYNNYICYFERTNGEYNTELRRNNNSKKFQNTNPRSRLFTKIDLAIAINCWQQFPHKVCEGREKNFEFFNSIVKNQMFDPDELYFKRAYATVIMFKKLDKMAKKLKITYKSNVISYTLSLISYLENQKVDLLKIWEIKDMPKDIENLALELLPKVHYVIENAPKEYPEARMWARKEACWEKIKKINKSTLVDSISEIVNFYPNNEPKIFIENEENLYNSLLWNKLLIWNDKYKILNNAQVNIIKCARRAASLNEKLTKKQAAFVKDTFMIAVKNKFIYK